MIPEDHVCKVCGNTPDQTGRLEHGKGCYEVSPEGGGVEYVTLEESKDQYIASLLREIERLKSGNLIPEEFHNLCHNLHEKGTPVTEEEFKEGCRQCRESIFLKPVEDRDFWHLPPGTKVRVWVYELGKQLQDLEFQKYELSCETQRKYRGTVLNVTHFAMRSVINVHIAEGPLSGSILGIPQGTKNALFTEVPYRSPSDSPSQR